MVITGRRPLATLTDNSSGTDWSISWYKADGTTVITALGQIVPLSGSIGQSADQKLVKDNRGNEVTVMASNEKITIELVAVPLGVSAHNTLADVEAAAQFPPLNSWLNISGAPVIAGGYASDMFNSSDWLYNNDARLELASDGEWGIRFSATRRVSMIKSAGVLF